MREQLKVVKEELITAALVCDKCGKRVTSDNDEDWIELEEFHSFTKTGGYGSLFGDMDTYTLDLCDKCWHSMVGDIVQYKKVWPVEDDGYGDFEEEPKDGCMGD